MYVYRDCIDIIESDPQLKAKLLYRIYSLKTEKVFLTEKSVQNELNWWVDQFDTYTHNTVQNKHTPVGFFLKSNKKKNTKMNMENFTL